MAKSKRKTANPTQVILVKSDTSIISDILKVYRTETPVNLKLIDIYLCCVFFIGVFQFIYCLSVGTFVYESFLAGFISAVASFVLAASLRIQLNKENGDKFDGILPQRAIADYMFAHVILHLTVINMIG